MEILQTPTIKYQTFFRYASDTHQISDIAKPPTQPQLEQILTIKLTFFQATFVMMTFVHIRNKNVDPKFVGLKKILDHKFFSQMFLTKTFCT